ncbi:DUF4123 domain-containing protein [Janthinobacterium lividum]|uniref:DUF4123 domain-containing protein n=1 Tax=Janthinobacterium lividum TaxID=29581 RepID=UPI00140B41C1|nr:DUF4123 domain-containing protein [Janthinobacterium lividum]NHQ91343.1 DUF4123 domain-containing protein [Janthinobacterium lividum]
MLIAPYADGWQAHLDTLAREATQGQARLYLLLDGAFLPELHRKLAALSPSLLFEALPGCTDATRDVSPLLLAYSAPFSAPPEAPWLARCSGWPMLSAIATRESQAELASRLAAWCIIEADGQRFNFRFPDTRRLPAIHAALTPEQQAQLAGPAFSWSYIARDGHWRQLPVLRQDSAHAERPVVLSEQQFASLVTDSEADEILAMLHERGHDHRQDRHGAYLLVAQALAAIAGEPLDTYDKADWCERWLRRGASAEAVPRPQTSMQEQGEAW